VLTGSYHEYFYGTSHLSMRIGELSKITGVSISTIRLYEREGFIAPASRTEGKFREFTPEQERRLNFIKRVRNLGFSFDDVKALLAMSDADADAAHDAEEVIKRIRSGISMRKSHLTSLDRQLERVLEGELPAPGLEDAFLPPS
jgi:DNA-binding transcriptional MerR regulator